MSAMLWKTGSEERLALHVRMQDAKFQEAMRAELQLLAQERNPSAVALQPPKARRRRPRNVAPPRVRDVITIASFIRLPEATAWQRIIADVCQKYGVSKQELTGEGRMNNTVLARQEAMYRMRKETTMSTPSIARRLGRADHTTVLYGIRKHAERMAAQ